MLRSHGRRIVGVAVALILLAGCVRVPLRARAQFRREQFFATHREVSPAVATAIDTGHLIIDMDRDEVRVVLGVPTSVRAG